MLESRHEHFKNMIPSIGFETAILSAARRYLVGLKKLRVQPPLFAMVTLTGVKEFVMSQEYPYLRNYKIGRDLLLLPEVMLKITPKISAIS